MLASTLPSRSGPLGIMGAASPLHFLPPPLCCVSGGLCTTGEGSTLGSAGLLAAAASDARCAGGGWRLSAGPPIMPTTAAAGRSSLDSIWDSGRPGRGRERRDDEARRSNARTPLAPPVCVWEWELSRMGLDWDSIRIDQILPAPDSIDSGVLRCVHRAP